MKRFTIYVATVLFSLFEVEAGLEIV